MIPDHKMLSDRRALTLLGPVAVALTAAALAGCGGGRRQLESSAVGRTDHHDQRRRHGRGRRPDGFADKPHPLPLQEGHRPHEHVLRRVRPQLAAGPRDRHARRRRRGKGLADRNRQALRRAAAGDLTSGPPRDAATATERPRRRARRRPVAPGGNPAIRAILTAADDFRTVRRSLATAITSEQLHAGRDHPPLRRCAGIRSRRQHRLVHAGVTHMHHRVQR